MLVHFLDDPRTNPNRPSLQDSKQMKHEKRAAILAIVRANLKRNRKKQKRLAQLTY
jgi:hypothetical protein